MLYKATITTEETYPKSFEVKFQRNVNTGDYFKQAHEFLDQLTKSMKVVYLEVECLGILEVIQCIPEYLDFFHKEGIKEL